MTTVGAARVWTGAQRQIAATLLDLAHQWGSLGDDGRTLLPAPMAELSARSGRSRNCGTVYAHIRALGDAVRPAHGQHGLLLDTAALAAIAGDATPGLRARHDRAATAGPYRPAATPPAADPPLPNPARTVPADISHVISVPEAVALARQLLACAAALLTACGLPQPPGLDPDLADHPRDPSRTNREIADQPRLTSSPDRREGGSFSKETPDKHLPPSLVPLPTQPVRDLREIRDAPSRTDHHPADPPPATARTPAQVEDLVQPLIDAANRCGLLGITDLAGLVAALAPYHDSQIRHAVNTTARMVRHGRVTSSPIGWLTTKARQADPDFFPATPPADHPPPAPTEPEAEPPDQADLEAETAVVGLEADPDRHHQQLAELDTHIRRHTTGASTQRRLFANPRLLHASRVNAWRQLHPSHFP
jgi:hypothetical protein